VTQTFEVPNPLRGQRQNRVRFRGTRQSSPSFDIIIAVVDVVTDTEPNMTPDYLDSESQATVVAKMYASECSLDR
jgi:hypothetical protein